MAVSAVSGALALGVESPQLTEGKADAHRSSVPHAAVASGHLV
jgi:hypothetical protein